MSALQPVLGGATVMACFVVGLFFLRFWRTTDDRLFGFFALAVSAQKVEQIEEKDIIVWANMSHVAAIDSFVDRDLHKVRICQSAGGGPRINEYTIVPLGNGTYRLQGGIPKWDVPGPVLISSLWEQD